jgi:hypothetical protein
MVAEPLGFLAALVCGHRLAVPSAAPASVPPWCTPSARPIATDPTFRRNGVEDVVTIQVEQPPPTPERPNVERYR